MTEQINRVKSYLAARDAKPFHALGDIIHGVNIGSEFEGELRLSDLRAFASSHAELVEALREANALILAPAEDLKDGVLSRIRAVLSKAEGTRP
jgi:hypothetical protein